MSMDNSGVVGKFRSFYSTIEQVRSPLSPCLLCFNQQICVLFNFLVMMYKNVNFQSSSTSVLDGLQIPRMKKIPMGVLDNRRFAGFLQAVFSTFLGTQPFLAHILPCLQELAKELQTKRHSTQLNNKGSTVPGKCPDSQSMQINFLEDSVSHCASVNMSSCLRTVSPGEEHALSS